MHEQREENVFVDLLKNILIVAVLVVGVRVFIAQPFIVSGQSMEPTFDNGNYLFVDELTYRFNDPERGDVIIFRYPKDTKQFFIKRIIGLPGETVTIRSGSVYVTNATGTSTKLSETYLVYSGNGQDQVTKLGKDEYFVMGDNRPESSDSRVWGVLPRTDIIGRAALRLLPLKDLDLFPGATKDYQNTH